MTTSPSTSDRTATCPWSCAAESSPEERPLIGDVRVLRSSAMCDCTMPMRGLRSRSFVDDVDGWRRRIAAMVVNVQAVQPSSGASADHDIVRQDELDRSNPQINRVVKLGVDKHAAHHVPDQSVVAKHPPVVLGDAEVESLLTREWGRWQSHDANPARTPRLRGRGVRYLGTSMPL